MSDCPDAQPFDKLRAGSPTPNPPVCPFCGSPRSEVVSLFGSQLLVDQRRCHGCSSYFEALRDDR